MIKRYYSMFNCNQNNHNYQKGIKYYYGFKDYVNVSENYDLHFAFYIISLLKFISFFKLV
jgi:hypothetical protein